MTDIIEGARALLAQATPGPWRYATNGFDRTVVGGPVVVREFIGTTYETGEFVVGGEPYEGAVDEDDPNIKLIIAAPSLLAALADECERLRKQNSEYHRRTQVAEAAVLEETTRGHRLGRSVGRSLANAAASTAMRECERLSSALDAMTNQAVMASGRRATIVTDDGELERLRAENEQHVDFRASINEALPRPFGVTVLGAIAELRAENARLREVMPGDDVRDEINDASVMLHEDGGMPATLAWLARLDAARKGVL